MYRLVEVDGNAAEVIRSLNALCPDTFPDLTDDHLDLGWWWILKTDANIICGFCGMVPHEPFPGVGYCKRAYISPDHRGRGLQLKMLEARIGKAKEIGWHMLVSETTCPFAARNFEEAGFQKCSPEQPWGKHGSMYFKLQLPSGFTSLAALETYQTILRDSRRRRSD